MFCLINWSVGYRIFRLSSPAFISNFKSFVDPAEYIRDFNHYFFKAKYKLLFIYYTSKMNPLKVLFKNLQGKPGVNIWHPALNRENTAC